MKMNEVIQNKRKELKMTQLQLAEKLDVSDKTVSRWESGIVYPNIDMIPKIAAILDISINELFGNNSKEFINHQEKRDYRKIALLKIFFNILLVSSLIFMLLLLGGKTLDDTVFIIAGVFWVSSILAYYINRSLFSVFYKEKFYIKEYKRLDAKYTTLANAINSSFIAVFLSSDIKATFYLFGFIIFGGVFVLTFFFLRKLNYRYNKRAFIPSIIAGIIFLTYFTIWIYFVYSRNSNNIHLFSEPFYIIMNFSVYSSLLFYIKEN